MSASYPIAARGDLVVREPGAHDRRGTGERGQRAPAGRSRALFTEEQIEADLDRLENEQQDDGGWTFDWLAWSPGQSVEWRGAMTLWVLGKLRPHGRIAA